MVSLRRSASNSRIFLSTRSTTSCSTPSSVAQPSDASIPHLDTNIPPGVRVTKIYHRPGRNFLARFLSSIAIDQVYRLEDADTEEGAHVAFCSIISGHLVELDSIYKRGAGTLRPALERKVSFRRFHYPQGTQAGSPGMSPARVGHPRNSRSLILG